jgi:hypothetical protein
MELIHAAPIRALLDPRTITRMPAGRRVKVKRPLGFANAVNSTGSSAALSYPLGTRRINDSEVGLQANCGAP